MSRTTKFGTIGSKPPMPAATIGHQLIEAVKGRDAAIVDIKRATGGRPIDYLHRYRGVNSWETPAIVCELDRRVVKQYNDRITKLRREHSISLSVALTLVVRVVREYIAACEAYGESVGDATPYDGLLDRVDLTLNSCGWRSDDAHAEILMRTSLKFVRHGKIADALHFVEAASHRLNDQIAEKIGAHP